MEGKAKMRVAHIALWTRNLDEAVAFWERYFGAAVGETYHSRRRPGFASRFVTLGNGGDRIELMSGPWVGDPAVECVGWDHIAISLGAPAAVDEMAERCDADGLLVSPPRTTGDGFYEAVISMPEGIHIEITA
jgi:lactoylglutathione lyase